MRLETLQVNLAGRGGVLDRRRHQRSRSRPFIGTLKDHAVCGRGDRIFGCVIRAPGETVALAILAGNANVIG